MKTKSVNISFFLYFLNDDLFYWIIGCNSLTNNTTYLENGERGAKLSFFVARPLRGPP